MPGTSSYKHRLAWHDRWSQPTLEQLVDPLKFHQKRTFTHLVERMDSYTEAARTILWFGPSWKWTLHYAVTEKALAAARAAHADDPKKPTKNGKTNGHPVNGKKPVGATASASPVNGNGHIVVGEGTLNPNTLLYLVPNLDHALICIPLSDKQIEVLPKKRMSRFIREGIQASKCAVQTHWAIWSPTSEAEIALLLELAKRKLDFMMGRPYKGAEHD